MKRIVFAICLVMSAATALPAGQLLYSANVRGEGIGMEAYAGVGTFSPAMRVTAFGDYALNEDIDLGAQVNLGIGTGAYFDAAAEGQYQFLWESADDWQPAVSAIGQVYFGSGRGFGVCAGAVAEKNFEFLTEELAPLTVIVGLVVNIGTRGRNYLGGIGTVLWRWDDQWLFFDQYGEGSNIFGARYTMDDKMSVVGYIGFIGFASISIGGGITLEL